MPRLQAHGTRDLDYKHVVLLVVRAATTAPITVAHIGANIRG